MRPPRLAQGNVSEMEWMDLFSQIDANKDGTLVFSEISANLSDLGYHESDIERVIICLDTGGYYATAM